MSDTDDQSHPQDGDEHRQGQAGRRMRSGHRFSSGRLGYRTREPRLGRSFPPRGSGPNLSSSRPHDTVPEMEAVPVPDAEDSGTDYQKRPMVDPFLDRGPKWWVAGLMALLFSGLGQLYNGRWLRGVLSVALPALVLGVAVVTGSGVFFLIAFWAGACLAPTALVLVAGLVGWVPLAHPAVWMGLPMKVAIILDAAFSAHRLRLQRLEPEVKPWARYAYLGSVGALLMLWIFTIGFASVSRSDMNPVLEPGDHVVIDRLAFGLQLPLVGVRLGGSQIPRGARVAALDPEGSGELLVRRVFALAGDRVAFGPQGGPAAIRQPMLGRGGALPHPVLWLPWRGPCVYALDRDSRRPGASYARCLSFVERSGRLGYRVSYPLGIPGPGAEAWTEGLVPRGHVYLLGDNRIGRDSRHFGFVSVRRIRGRPDVILWSRDPLEGIRWDRMGLRITDTP